VSKKSIFIIVSLMIIIVYFFTLGDDLSLNNNIEPKTNKQEESSKSINIVANTEQPYQCCTYKRQGHQAHYS